MKVLISAIFIIANIPSLAQAETKATHQSKVAVKKAAAKAPLKKTVAVAKAMPVRVAPVAPRPSTLVAPIAKVGTNVPTAHTAAVNPSSVNFGAPGASPINYGYSSMPQGGIVMPGYPAATMTGAPAASDPNFQQMAPALMSALSGMNGMKFSDDSGTSRRRRSASSPDEEDDTESTPAVRSSSRSSPSVSSGDASGGDTAAAAAPNAPPGGDTANAMATNSGTIMGTTPPTGDVPPAPGDTANANTPPESASAAPGAAAANSVSSAPAAGAPPGPQDQQVASANPADTQHFTPDSEPAAASDLPVQQQAQQQTPTKPAQQQQHTAQPAPQHPHFPQCGVDHRYADDPKVIAQMMESINPTMKHSATHTLGAGACRINFKRLPEPSLVLTNCRVSGSIAATVCLEGNSLVAVTDSTKAEGWKLAMAPKGMTIALTPDNRGNWTMSNSVTNDQAQFTEMASAQRGTSSR